jgi:NAD(P) transhydrogenase subunit beta
VTVVVAVLSILAFSLFILGLCGLTGPRTAVRGNKVAAVGMAVAVLATLLTVRHNWPLILGGLVVGAALGGPAARRVRSTTMPQMVALGNGVGGGAVALVAWSLLGTTDVFAGEPLYVVVASLFGAVVGSVSFWGSLVAFGRLQEILPGRPLGLGRAQQAVDLLLLAGTAACAASAAIGGGGPWMLGLLVLAAVLGVMVVLPIGGADLPVVIALLNALTGLSAAAVGLALGNPAMIVAGMLVGASGTILAKVMATAVHHSIPAVVAGGFGTTSTRWGADAGADRGVTTTTAAAAALRLADASRVIVVPGYGMAVAQAQHAVEDLADQLEKRGVEVTYAIHPVAGRLPGHMNVLLAEAGVPDDALRAMDEINDEFPRTDVTLVVGANDVTNPAARTDLGTPILDVDRSRSVIVLKRSMNSGFAGIDNPLFHAPHTSMLFGDAKASVREVTEELNAL